MQYKLITQALITIVMLVLTAASRAADTDASNNHAVVKAYFDLLFKQHDLVAVEKLIAKDAVYTQAAGLPYGGRYVGFEEWKQMFAKVSALVDIDIEGSPVILANMAGSRIMVQFNAKFHAKKTQREITMPIAEQFDLADGKVVAITPFYFDTKTFSEFSKE
jgi:ketosteroid isomerase-like protein